MQSSAKDERARAPGHFVATGSRDKTIRLWDTTTGQCIRILVRRGCYCPVFKLEADEASRFAYLRLATTTGCGHSSSTRTVNFFSRRRTTKQSASGISPPAGVARRSMRTATLSRVWRGVGPSFRAAAAARMAPTVKLAGTKLSGESMFLRLVVSINRSRYVDQRRSRIACVSRLSLAILQIWTP